ncbi:MAG TPA: phytoene/squalene synthase family protein [Kofleriaceae bacterium]|nr:phytoene/squalene synthase family protein [Kofleriaceae bacterium]
MSAAVAEARRVLAAKSKSFALAGRMLGGEVRDRAAVVYAFCRRADDAIDLAPAGRHAEAIERLRGELEAVYAGRPTGDAVLDAFGEVARACRIPREYPAELIAGLAMDAAGTRYGSLAELGQYCYRVAGTVGLMMCHVLGLRHDRALPRAVHLGVAMQLTNICRDVGEDWELGRLYLPADMLAQEGAPELASALGGPFPAAARRPVARVVRRLLAEAERFYASADRGIFDLPPRAAFAVRIARLVYAAIGTELAGRGHDPLAGRAVVPAGKKLALVALAGAGGAFSLAAPSAGKPRVPDRILVFSPDVLSLS